MNNVLKTTLKSDEENLLEEARELVPLLKEYATETEALGRLHPRVVTALHDSGLWRIIQPKQVGGANLSYRAMIEVTVELGRGCGSTAWVYGNLASHHWMLAMWPKAAQDCVWLDDPDALIASSVIFQAGQAESVAGGYVLNGRWPFCSGIDISGWVMLGGMVEVNGKGRDPRLFLVPKSDIEVLETWDVSGLCGTGSKDVVASRVFVRDEMSLRADVLGGATPGSEVNPDAVYKLPVQALFSHIIAAPIVGITRCAVDDFISTNTSSVSLYNKSKIAQHPTVQIRLSDATSAIESAQMLLYRNCDEALEIINADGHIDVGDKHRWRRDAAYGANLCADAVASLYRISGGKAACRSNPMQRYYRDVSVGINHINMSRDIIGAEYGSYALGLGGNPNI